MNLSQSAGAFSGPYSGAVFSVYDSTYLAPASGTASGQIVSGTTTGALVYFSLDTDKQLFQGVLTDSAMSGSGTIIHTGSNGSATFNGTWTAERTK